MPQTRRKLEERNIRKITKMAGGSSYGVTLPIEMVRKLKWKEHQKVVVTLRGKKLSIEDWPIRPIRQVQGRQAQGKKE